jgi:hypothetical protein
MNTLQETSNTIIESDVQYLLLNEDDEGDYDGDGQPDMMEKQQKILMQHDRENDDDKLWRATKRWNRNAFGAGFLSYFCLSMLAYPYALLMLVLLTNDGEEKSLSELIHCFQYSVINFTSYLPILACLLNIVVVYSVASKRGYHLIFIKCIGMCCGDNNGTVGMNESAAYAMVNYFGSGFAHGSFLSWLVILVFLRAPLPLTWEIHAVYVSFCLLDGIVVTLGCFGIVPPIL